MTETECLAKMVAPGQVRQGKWRGGVIQVHVTRACDRACYSCTQGSNLGGKAEFMPPALFEQALLSLKGYFGVVGLFGGNPAVSPHFAEYCALMRQHVPFEQRGLWCNDLRTEANGRAARTTFNPAVSNLNVHLSLEAYARFKLWWPESMPFGLHKDSRHSPCYIAMKDVLRKPCPTCKGTGHEPYNNPYTGQIEYGENELCANCDECLGNSWVYDEPLAHELISGCDINQHWSAMVCMFRGELRAFFCEIAGAQAMLHQHEPEYPDTGVKIELHEGSVACGYQYAVKGSAWWEWPMIAFVSQVRKHCHECGVPLRGHGQLACGSEDQSEQVSVTHANVYKLKRQRRPLEVVTDRSQLGAPLQRMTNYLGNA